jgi:nucleoside-diphosphate-sugar epimerase
MSDVALVTGASGFIGGHLVKELIRSGWSVHALGRPTARFHQLESSVGAGLVAHVDPGDAGELVRIVDSIRPSVCFHLASHFVVQHQISDVPLLVDSNIAFPIRLANALAAVGDVTLVNVGTAWQHRESRPYGPVNLYAATKQAFEDILVYYAESRQMQVVNLKLFDTFGPGDPRPKLFNLLLTAARQGTELELSPGYQLIDLVHVSDVVSALLAGHRAAGDKATGFGVSSGQPVSLRRLVEIFEEETGLPIRAKWGIRPYRSAEMFEPWDAGPPPPGWSPRIELACGIREVLKAFDG